MTNYLIVPGLGNSGPEHWQTYFEKSGDNFHRILQKEWDEPDCNDWVEEIEKVVSMYDPATVILIGHSSGCSAIAYWAARYNRQIKGAMIVGPTDTEAPQYDFPTKHFKPVPHQKIAFKTIVAASENDPWVSIERAKYFADNWGSEFVNIGKAGHINASSGHGEWKEGLEILKKLG